MIIVSYEQACSIKKQNNNTQHVKTNQTSNQRLLVLKENGKEERIKTEGERVKAVEKKAMAQCRLKIDECRVEAQNWHFSTVSWMTKANFVAKYLLLDRQIEA